MTPASSVRTLQSRRNHDTKLRKVVTSWIGKRGLRGWASTATGQQMGTVLFVESCHPKLQNNLVFGFCTKNFQKLLFILLGTWTWPWKLENHFYFVHPFFLQASQQLIKNCIRERIIRQGAFYFLENGGICSILFTKNNKAIPKKVLFFVSISI